MRLIVVIQKQNDGTFIAYNTNVDGLSLIGTGRTIDEAKEDFCNSMNEVAETYKENEIPECLKNTPLFKQRISNIKLA